MRNSIAWCVFFLASLGHTSLRLTHQDRPNVVIALDAVAFICLCVIFAGLIWPMKVRSKP
jgi:hypothetical protein